MNTLMQYVEKMLKHLVVTGIGLMLVIVFVQVITRYCFNYTPSFAEELSRYLFVWVVFLALPLVAKSGGHMAIETITSRLSGVKLKVARVLADIATMAFLALMTMEGVRMVEISHFQTSPAMLLPMSYVYVVIPFGCAVMLVNVARHFIDLLRTAAHEVK